MMNFEWKKDRGAGIKARASSYGVRVPPAPLWINGRCPHHESATSPPDARKRPDFIFQESHPQITGFSQIKDGGSPFWKSSSSYRNTEAPKKEINRQAAKSAKF
jgi:hypothetical protein